MCLYRPIAGSAALPSQGAKPVTVEDVQKVHALVEMCLQNQMTLSESCHALWLAGVPQKFTTLVWQRLELENPEFFKAYNADLVCLQHLPVST